MEQIIQYFIDISQGIPTTLGLIFLSLIMGFLLACLFTIGNIFLPSVGRKFLNLIVAIFRGSPLLVQMFFLYYGLGYLVSFMDLPFRINAFWYAICALTLNTAAYTTVILLGSIGSIPKEQIESGKCLGMSSWRIFSKIICPQALRYALPAYGNEMILITKASSLASSITIMEVTGYATLLASKTYDIMAVFGVAAGIYLFINVIFTLLIGLFESLLSRKGKVA